MKELYNDIFQMVDISSQSNVVEIGIGGGQATLPILQTGCKLTAVKYGDKLAALCCEKFKEYSKFSAIVGKFEVVDLNTNACDLVYSASAFHWVPEEIVYRKGIH